METNLDNEPIIKLIDYTKEPFNLSIASARTCYSSKGILYPEDMVKTEKSIEIRDRVAKSTKKAGHLTTRQHPQFIYSIDKVSRQFVWAFLHSHPFYNSEQVSQRYVEVKDENYYLPPHLNEKEKKLFLESVRFSTQSYFQFSEMLKPVIEKEYFSIFKARADYPEKWQIPIKKKAIEVARYFLPLATFTYMYHSISGITLHRYHRLMNSYNVPKEQSRVVQKMIDLVGEIDPLFIKEMDDPIPLEETQEYLYFEKVFGTSLAKNFSNAKDFIKEYDSDLNGRYSKLVGYYPNGEKLLTDALRSVLSSTKSSLSDEDAIRMLLDPSLNRGLTSTLNETTMSPISRAMLQLSYTFKKKISHTADSQDQRHRMVPGSRPVLLSQFSGEPDYIIPFIVKKYPELLDFYESTMIEIFKKIKIFAEATTDSETISYLLPNAFPIRFYETGNLLMLYHKWKTRLCYNAQEEIFQASVEEVEDLSKVNPDIAKWLRAPCWIRMQGGVKPFCPEGDKYCGVQVWKNDSLNYVRTI
ncbi:MAG: FAD-dependent thymidylate synthase [Leptospiraceae bacterium]|nr:FAD-dependent thymidylate synthase [Leptospiraceae bacterium]MCK6379799.1 FAD-dependent thymidylate synthase [Leptospiraceae bacterium]NUM41422.1 FAD-dependent thymidylate synthase [Leptospiraceae bacterium]